jgi:hypothetical protein
MQEHVQSNSKQAWLYGASTTCQDVDGRPSAWNVEHLAWTVELGTHGKP